jgi:hypothetical protein
MEQIFGREQQKIDPEAVVLPTTVNRAGVTNDAPVSDQGYHMPGGTVGYPAQPRLIRSSVSPLSDITFNCTAENCPGPTNLVKYSLKIVN